MLPPELINVATAMEQQFDSLKVNCRKVPLDEWNMLSAEVKALIPTWLMELMANHRLSGPLLERPHETGTWERYFRFWSPTTYLRMITPNDLVASQKNGWWLAEEMIQAGFIPLCDESDGDLWLTSLTGDASSPVILYDLSGDQRKVMAENMALFLVGCKISPAQPDYPA
jgi:hypothetical protein